MVKLALFKEKNKIRLILVSGPAGAGRTTAIRSLEDLGFEAIDNLPLDLVKSVLKPKKEIEKIDRNFMCLIPKKIKGNYLNPMEDD